VIRVGPAGWDYPDWRGIVYPSPKPRGFDPLAYLCRYFRTIEINSTFYRPAAPKAAKSWAERVAGNREFRFTAKLWRRFTHERGTAWTRDEVKAARAGLDLLQEEDRLGAVLLQFPWSFRNSDEGKEWLGDLFKDFGHLPLVLEVRHASWATPDVLSWLAEQGVGLVNVDQPLFKNTIRPAAHATGAVGYVRLHGRNYQDWFRKTAGRDERYDYLYTAKELTPWVTRIETLAAKTKDVYAVTNNHHLGKAPANAEMIEAMLTGEKALAPATLREKYPTELGPYTRAD
jgi:uncharacterized protein YecE (DUF72 family)